MLVDIPSIPASFATCSIGSASTPLPAKLRAIASAGFQGIELAFPDLVTFAETYLEKNVKADDYESICSAGKEVKRLCTESGLKIVMLQPFANYEGWEEGSEERNEALSRAKGWISVMEAVGTDMLQVGSSDSNGITGDKEELAKDLSVLADMLGQKGFKLAYENWCWATHAPTWEDAWDIVQRTGKDNVGLCLDTFQTAGGEWADPTTQSGHIETESKQHLEESYKASLAKLANTVLKDKIYIFQISDAYKPSKALEAVDKDGLRPRGRWSHDYRPMPYAGGYLPIVPMVTAVLETGFRSWFSMEIFDGGEDGAGKEVGNLDDFAKKAMESHRRLVKDASG
ncbi:putative 3-dehydroshikimate dehydratase [Pleomassaria siparia CBS 279.74]|uniref:Putative 3-dehydroshikimate dehydratase n=1 Tax=Pleomassaria siparia CBS 279.74 TaxID=1314801 RepID=A0A6G1JST3_9PLEO|nr:putative 3-dehydroshikimate dehydratase [Pleomassaria siparia CBS 279.74]